MATSLLDILQKNKQPAPQANPLQDLALTLSAKTGKATQAQAGPAPTGMAQRAAQAQTTSQLGQVEQAKGVEVSGLQQQQAAQQAQAASQGAALDQQKLAQQDELSRQTSAIVGDLERNRKTLSEAEKRSRVEQAGFLLGLQNKEYLQNLEQTANLRRWQDELAFKTDLQKSIFADNMTLFENDQSFLDTMAMDDMEFQKYLQSIDLKSAMDSAKRQAKAQSKRQIFGGIGQIGGALAGGASGGGGSGGGAGAEAAGGAQNTSTMSSYPGSSMA